MKLIATHNSATGEAGTGLLSWLSIPFSRCQRKSIREQWMNGARLFDIRVKYIQGEWRCAHGVWKSKRTATDILGDLDSLCSSVVTLTYEGGYEREDEFKEYVEFLKSSFKNIKFADVAVKYGEDGCYGYIDRNVSVGYPCRQGFICLDGSTWHTYIPIPWLWNLLYTREHVFRNDVYTYVDFL